MYSVLIAIFMLGFIFAMTLISYRLGQRKTDNPKLTAIIGCLLSLFPPFALIFVAVLAFKEDLDIV